MLEQEYKTLYTAASSIPNWQTMNKNDLINAYIDNEEDKSLRNSYFAAIMCRYWKNIFKYYAQSKNSGFTIEDCYSWLVEAIMIALRYRSWKKPNSILSQDENAPDKVINRCIYSRRQYYYYIANLKKNRGEYTKILLSTIEDDISNDHNKFLEDKNQEFIKANYDLYFVLRKFFLNKEYAKGIVFYTIIKDDNCIEKDRVNISRVMSSLLKTDYSSLAVSLNIDNKYDKMVKELKLMDPKKLFKVIKNIVRSISTDKELENELCY